MDEEPSIKSPFLDSLRKEITQLEREMEAISVGVPGDADHDIKLKAMRTLLDQLKTKLALLDAPR